MPGTFEIKKAKNGEFYFNLRARNGEIILTSERYKGKSGATNGIASVMKNAADEKRYAPLTAKNGKPYFVLKSGNHQVIGKSEMYETPGACKKGIASVTKNAPGAKVVDTTA